MQNNRADQSCHLWFTALILGYVCGDLLAHTQFDLEGVRHISCDLQGGAQSLSSLVCHAHVARARCEDSAVSDRPLRRRASHGSGAVGSLTFGSSGCSWQRLGVGAAGCCASTLGELAPATSTRSLRRIVPSTSRTSCGATCVGRAAGLGEASQAYSANPCSEYWVCFVTVVPAVSSMAARSLTEAIREGPWTTFAFQRRRGQVGRMEFQYIGVLDHERAV